MSHGKQIQEADRRLARAGWRALIRRRAPWWAALWVVVIFAIRGWVCPPETLDRGASPSFKWHGNYCGPGYGGSGAPVDDLDAACMEHDRAYDEARRLHGDA